LDLPCSTPGWSSISFPNRGLGTKASRGVEERGGSEITAGNDLGRLPQCFTRYITSTPPFLKGLHSINSRFT
jgi:hypothetical protein